VAFREIGEPARKALIVDLAAPSCSGSVPSASITSSGSLTIAPAAFIGGLLWEVTPALPFWMAG